MSVNGYVCVCFVLQCSCSGKKTTVRNWVFPSTLWVSGLKLRPLLLTYLAGPN